MEFRTRKLIKPEDLNPRGTLFGGRVMEWIDEESAIFAICQLESIDVVTKFISEMDFVSTAHSGEIIEIGTEVVKFGVTSITIAVEVREKTSKRTIVKIDKVVFVNVDKDGKPTPHGKGGIQNSKRNTLRDEILSFPINSKEDLEAFEQKFLYQPLVALEADLLSLAKERQEDAHWLLY
jgi:acyl-CoA hydrolase